MGTSERWYFFTVQDSEEALMMIAQSANEARRRLNIPVSHIIAIDSLPLQPVERDAE